MVAQVGIGDMAAIVLAGGASSRSGAGVNKVYAKVAGRPMLAYSLQAFEAADVVAEIVLVIRESDRHLAETAVVDAKAGKVCAVVAGGVERHGSELAGLTAVAQCAPAAPLIAIHDGARPFVTADLITALATAASRRGGAVPAVRCDAPVFRVSGDGRARRVRDDLVRVQTPQVFRAAELHEAYSAAEADRFSGVDTAETVERYADVDTAVVLADSRNIKVTYAVDFDRAARLASDWSPTAWLRG